MPRLYYPPTNEARTASGKSGAVFNVENGIEKVAKVVPVEVITAYSGIVAASHISQRVSTQHILYWAGFAICCVATYIYISKMAEPGYPKIVHLFFSTLAFPIWAYFTTGEQVVPSIYDPGIALSIVVAWGLLSGIVPFDR